MGVLLVSNIEIFIWKVTNSSWNKQHTTVLLISLVENFKCKTFVILCTSLSQHLSSHDTLSLYISPTQTTKSIWKIVCVFYSCEHRESVPRNKVHDILLFVRLNLCIHLYWLYILLCVYFILQRNRLQRRRPPWSVYSWRQNITTKER